MGRGAQPKDGALKSLMKTKCNKMPEKKKRKKVVFMTARTMDYCRRKGGHVGKTEQWVVSGRPDAKAAPADDNKQRSPRGYRKDLFGWIDIIWLSPKGNTIGIQACAMSGRGEHLDKIQSDPDVVDAVADWASRPNHKSQIWSWRKLLPFPGAKRPEWKHEVTDLSKLVVVRQAMAPYLERFALPATVAHTNIKKEGTPN